MLLAAGAVLALSAVGVSPAVAGSPFSTTAGGATIDFDDDDHLLTTGETFTPEITVTTTAVPPLVDLVFLVDGTASMGTMIGWLRAVIADVVQAFIDQGANPGDMQIGITCFGDGYGDMDNFWGSVLALGANSPADAAAALALGLGSLPGPCLGGADLPEDTIAGYMKTMVETAWRPGALHHIMAITDAQAKERADKVIGGQPVTPAGLAALAGEYGVTISTHVEGAGSGMGVDEAVAITQDDLVAAVNVARPGTASVSHSANAEELKENLEYTVTTTETEYVETPSVSCVYASDGAPSADITVTFSPASHTAVGAEVFEFELTATPVTPAGRLEETVCTIVMTVNGETTPIPDVEFVRWAPEPSPAATTTPTTPATTPAATPTSKPTVLPLTGDSPNWPQAAGAVMLLVLGAGLAGAAIRRRFQHAE
jgi:hypothetical protein